MKNLYLQADAKFFLTVPQVVLKTSLWITKLEKISRQLLILQNSAKKCHLKFEIKEFSIANPSDRH